MLEGIPGRLEYLSVIVLLSLCGCGSTASVVKAASPASINITGAFTGQMLHNPSFPALDFNVAANIQQLANSGDRIPLQATLVRDATDCWTNSPIAMKGDFVVSRDGNGNILLRKVFLWNADAPTTVTLEGTMTADLNSGQFSYNSIIPDQHPCQSIAASGTLSR